MEHFVDLNGSIYFLSNRIRLNGLSYRCLCETITVRTFITFLNSIRHCENDNNPLYINLVNLDAQIYFDRLWMSKQGYEDKPVVLVNYYGAKAFADHFGLQLMPQAMWRLILSLEKEFIEYYDLPEINIEEKYGGPMPADKRNPSKLGIYDLIGNVAFWGEEVQINYPLCYGIGWNKSRINIRSEMIQRRWARISSISTGLRYIIEDED